MNGLLCVCNAKRGSESKEGGPSQGCPFNLSDGRQNPKEHSSLDGGGPAAAA